MRVTLPVHPVTGLASEGPAPVRAAGDVERWAYLRNRDAACSRPLSPGQRLLVLPRRWALSPGSAFERRCRAAVLYEWAGSSSGGARPVRAHGPRQVSSQARPRMQAGRERREPVKRSTR